MNELPYELIEEILSYLEITCHSCYNIIKVKNLNNVIKLNKFYYCDKICFDFFLKFINFIFIYII